MFASNADEIVELVLSLFACKVAQTIVFHLSVSDLEVSDWDCRFSNGACTSAAPHHPGDGQQRCDVIVQTTFALLSEIRELSLIAPAAASQLFSEALHDARVSLGGRYWLLRLPRSQRHDTAGAQAFRKALASARDSPVQHVSEVVYINLDSKPERRARMESMLQDCPFPVERFSACVGGTAWPSLGMAVPTPEQVLVSESRRNAVLGCYSSHCTVLQRIAESGDDSVRIILEDDVALDPLFWSACEYVTPPVASDIVLVDCWGVQYKPDRIDSLWYRPSRTSPYYGGTHCCVVYGAAGARGVLDHLTNVERGIYDVDGKLFEYDRCTLWFPSLAKIEVVP